MLPTKGKIVTIFFFHLILKEILKKLVGKRVISAVKANAKQEMKEAVAVFYFI